MPQEPEMSQNVDRVFEAISSGRLEQALDLADPEIELRPLLGNIEGQTYRGHEGIRRWYRQLNEIFEDLRIELDEVEELDGDVIATGTIHVRARGSGALIAQPASWLATMRRGKATRLEVFSDRASAARAAHEP